MRLNEEKWALFDFCETLVNFQTADTFVDFVCKQKPKIVPITIGLILRILAKIKFFRMLDQINGSELYLLKIYRLCLLKGYSQTELEEYAKLYYKTRIIPNLIKVTTDRLIQLKNDGYKILIVSGGYSIYIKHFVKQFKVDGLIANTIKFKEGRCLGKLEGLNCMNKNKSLLLNSYFISRPIYSEAYSDSITDVPFLQWADKGVVISKGIHQEWIDNYGFSEIVWL